MTSTSYDDYDLSNNGDTISYEVVAVDTSGNESAAATISATAAPTFNAAGADPACSGTGASTKASGTMLHDSSGNGNNGTINDATWSSTGKFGNCLYFDGSQRQRCGPGRRVGYGRAEDPCFLVRH